MPVPELTVAYGFDAKDYTERRARLDTQPGLMDYLCPCGLHACAWFCACWQERRGKSNGWGIADPTGRVWIYGDRQEALKRKDRWTHLDENPEYITGCSHEVMPWMGNMRSRQGLFITDQLSAIYKCLRGHAILQPLKCIIWDIIRWGMNGINHCWFNKLLLVMLQTFKGNPGY